jgi:hypothetical protein
MTTAILARTHAGPLAEIDDPPYQRAVRPGLLSRIWSALASAGERRAAADIARHVRLMGGQPTGDLERDVELIVALRGLR